jgi:hypothetical protein
LYARTIAVTPRFQLRRASISLPARRALFATNFICRAPPRFQLHRAPRPNLHHHFLNYNNLLFSLQEITPVSPAAGHRESLIEGQPLELPLHEIHATAPQSGGN